MESSGIIMFNRGSKMLIHALVSLHSLRKHYNGDVTFYVQNPCDCMDEFKRSLSCFNCNVVQLEDKNEYKTLVMKNSLFENPPYDKTLWIDSDTVVVGKIDEMFTNLNDDVDLCIPSFCQWTNNGHHMSARINRFKGLVEDRYIAEALKPHPSINTGILSFKKSDKWNKFVHEWTAMADLGGKHGIFIPDETAANIVIPSIQEWGLKCYICPTDYNVSPLHDHGLSKDPRIYHFHGNKSTLNVSTCDVFKKELAEMTDSNVANIKFFFKYADKRMSQYLRQKNDPNFASVTSDTTIVTATDSYYVDILRYTFTNWVKYKHIDKNPVIVFVNGMELTDTRLDFLRLPNVQLIPWNENCMDKVDSHRELMLSAFVFGAADHVQTEYWVKLDADSYATNSKPLITENMKNYSIFSHKWGYSRPDHVRKLDEWSKTCWHKKFKGSKPMMEQGRVEGNRFYHNTKRFISYVCFQKTRFTRYCVKLLNTRRLPSPSQDTFAYYCIQKLKPEAMGIGNFKRDYGFTQGRGKLGAENIKRCVEEVDMNNVSTPVSVDDESSEEGKES